VALVALGCLWLAPGAVAAATLTVNTTRDELTRHDRKCSLREAITAVNAPGTRTDCGAASRRSNQIVLGRGRYNLSIAVVGADDNSTGDLDVIGAAPLTISGAGARATVIDARSLGDRVMSVASGGGVTLVGLSVTDGHAAEGVGGGGILNAGTLVLDAVSLSGNRAGAGAALAGAAGGSGGGVYSTGRLGVVDSTISANRAGDGGPAGPGGFGGGIFSSGGRLRVTNTTLSGNLGGAGTPGGNGGAIAVVGGAGLVRSATVADNGAGGGVYAQAATVTLQNTIVASNLGANCTAAAGSSIVNGGHDLTYGDNTCPGQRANPRLDRLSDYGGGTQTMAIRAGSPAIDRTARKSGDCPASDQRGVRRPQGRACDIGAYEFAMPVITMVAPFNRASYERHSRVVARFSCDDGGVASAIATCKGSIAIGHSIDTGHVGTVRFVVTAIDKSGNRTRQSIRYEIWEYVNPLREVSGLTPRRIDLGVDYAGWGPLLAIGRGVVTTASNTDDGPSSCWAISCWPGGGIVVYRLLDGPFAGKYVYVAEHITVYVRAGQTVNAGQQIATLHTGYPWSEWGWAAGGGPEAMAMATGHRCTCSDPGGWSTIEGRDMNHLLVQLGAPSGFLQGPPPAQSMPAGWPVWP
jgi:CSLREA domain-containing protein